MKSLASSFAICTLLAGCVSITSTPDPLDGNKAGYTYYLPKKDFVVTVTVTKGQPTAIDFALTPAYPDTSRPFVLKYPSNWIGTNVANVEIDENGLLKSSKATVTSGVSDILTSVASIVGTVGVVSVAPVDKPCVDAAHTFVVRSVDDLKEKFCGVTVSIEALSPYPKGAFVTPNADDESYAGLFYRQAKPFLLRASGPLNAAKILLAPRDGDVRFLPIARTLFAKNDIDMTFVDGMPTKYDDTRDGEVVALLKLPAAIMTAYFNAVGAVFDSFKTRDDKDSDAIAARLKLELEKSKLDACVQAIRNHDDATSTKLGCGQ